MKLFCKLMEIAAGGVLEYTKVKFWQDGQGMVKDICLDRFIIGPGLVVAEDIDLHRQTFVCGLQVPDQEGHLLANHRVVLQVFFQVLPENAKIGVK